MLLKVQLKEIEKKKNSVMKDLSQVEPAVVEAQNGNIIKYSSAF